MCMLNLPRTHVPVSWHQYMCCTECVFLVCVCVCVFLVYVSDDLLWPARAEWFSGPEVRI